MQGTILVIDGVATNRIVLKVQLTAACFNVVQADSVKTALAMMERVRPDLIVSAMSLSDGCVTDIKRGAAQLDWASTVPIIALSHRQDRQTRLAALAAGVEEVLPLPVDDMILQARIRSLLRLRLQEEDLHLRDEGSLRVNMPSKPDLPQSEITVALVGHDLQSAQTWKSRLAVGVDYQLTTLTLARIQSLLSAPVPDVIVIELNEASAGMGLRLMADLRARASSRDSIVIAVPSPADALIAAEALDRGAHDVLQCGFHVEELALRIQTQLRYKQRADAIRDSLRNGLRAAMRDPMTGLYNRRYAKPFLERIANEAAQTGAKFSLMMADLDHFKKINDQYGHPVGDAVLIEAADRMGKVLADSDLLARVGGEEFMIVLPDSSELHASEIATSLCNAINTTPFTVAGIDRPLKVTISIGAIVGGPSSDLSCIDSCIAAADRALYDAKDAGRNRIAMPSAAVLQDLTAPSTCGSASGPLIGPLIVPETSKLIETVKPLHAPIPPRHPANLSDTPSPA